MEVSSPILPDPNGRIYDDERVHRATVLQDGSVHLLRVTLVLSPSLFLLLAQSDHWGFQGKFLIRRCNITMLPKEEEEKKKKG